MTIVNMHEAKTQLSKLVDAVQRGETVIIARGGKPAAKLCALDEDSAGWTEQALAFFRSAPDPELSDFELPRDDLGPLEDRDLF